MSLFKFIIEVGIPYIIFIWVIMKIKVEYINLKFIKFISSFSIFVNLLTTSYIFINNFKINEEIQCVFSNYIYQLFDKGN